MKTFLIAAAAVAAIAAGTSVANAQVIKQVYGSVGVVQQDGQKSDSKLNGLNARVGAKLSPHFGVEGELTYGTNKDNRPEGDYKLTNKAAIYGVGYLPINDKFDLLGRVGVSDTDLKAPATVGKIEQGTALDYGVGAQYHFNKDYAVRADLTKSDFSNHKGSANTTTISVVKTF